MCLRTSYAKHFLKWLQAFVSVNLSLFEFFLLINTGISYRISLHSISFCHVHVTQILKCILVVTGLGLGLGFRLGLGLDMVYPINFELAKTVEWFGG
eukprot:sb/3478988/